MVSVLLPLLAVTVAPPALLAAKVPLVTDSATELTSPSTSETMILSAPVKSNWVSSLTVIALGAVIVASFSMSFTTTSKKSLTLTLLLSVAVTFIEMVPVSALVGVPLNVLVVALKLNQLGSIEPSASSAEYVSTSPLSISLKALAAN